MRCSILIIKDAVTSGHKITIRRIPNLNNRLMKKTPAAPGFLIMVMHRQSAPGGAAIHRSAAIDASVEDGRRT